MNYINNNNQNQQDLGFDQMNNNLLMNHYGLSDPQQLSQSNYPNQIQIPMQMLQPHQITQPNQMTQPNQFGNFSNDNLINMANSIDPNSLNGTTLDDNNDMGKMFVSKNKNNDNKSLIKSLTKEIINNLKENNMSLYDNSSINSRTKRLNDDNEEEDNITNYSSSNNSSSSKQKKHKKKKEIDIKEKIEDFVVGGESPDTTNYVQWFFDDCFNYKDFFSKYFTSLNPDNEGKVGVQGVIIYGLVLTILFMVIRKLL